MLFKTSPKEIILFTLLLISLEILLFSLLWKSPIVLYPGDNISLEAFSDTSEVGGNSSVESQVYDDKIEVSYTLRDGYEWAFAGMRIKPKSALNLLEYDYMQIEIEGKDEQHAILSYWTAPTSIGKDSIIEQPHFYGLKMSADKNSYRIPFSSFIVPQWWLAYQDIELSDLPVNSMKQVMTIDVRSGYEEVAGTQSSFTIKHISFLKSHTAMYVSMISLIVVAVLLLWLKKYIEHKSAQKKLVVPLKELEIDKGSDNPLDKVISVIGSECDNPDLNLYRVAQLCQIPELEVSKAIKNEFSLNFKQYLNRVRMEVATTLLKESSMTIKEITFKSGYKTNTHFFRVFRSFYNESPTEYRNRELKSR